MKLYTASETRKIDNLAIKEKEISGYSLMQMAAEFSLDVILREFSPVEELIIFAQKEKTLEMVFFWEVMLRNLVWMLLWS